MSEVVSKKEIRNKKELWERIRNYKFNNLVSKSLLVEIVQSLGGKNAPVRAFAHKIMKKHRLPRAFTFRAIEEYKKFVYLGVVSDFVVTPSKYIDIVWHEHLLFSKGYREFCDEVIQYQFDHQPELIAMEDQTETFTAQYLETLDLYRREFGIEPPENIWGVPKFDKDRLNAFGPRSKKKNYDSGYVGDYSSDGPLHTNYDGDNLDGEFSGFDSDGFGGGDFGGGGAGGDWGDSSSDGGSDGGSSCSSCSGGCSGGD